MKDAHGHIVPLQQQIDRLLPDEAPGMFDALVHTKPVNEGRHARELRHHLRERKRPENGMANLHLGVAGFLNFDLAAESRADGLLLADINREQLRFWRSIIEMLQECPTIDSFKLAFLDRVSGNGFWLDADGNASVGVRNVEKTDQEGSPHSDPTTLFDHQYWLRDAEKYAHLRRLACDGKIATLPINLYEAASCETVREAVNQLRVDGKQARLDTVYASNVYDIKMPHADDMLLIDYNAFLRSIKKHYEEHKQQHPPGAAYHRAIDEATVGLKVRLEKHVRDMKKAGQLDLPLEDALDAVKRCAEPVAEAFLRLSGDAAFGEHWDRYVAMQLRKKEKADKAINDPVLKHRLSHLHYELTHRVLREVALTEGIEQEDLRMLHYVGVDEHGVYGENNGEPSTMGYAALRQIATDADTEIFCSSIRPRPLIKFAGPDSPRTQWRARMQEEALNPQSQAATR